MTDAEELARAVAVDMDPMIAAELEREIKGEPPPGGGTRAFGPNEIMSTVGFLFSAASVVMEVVRARRQSAELVADLASGLEIDPRLKAHLDPEKRLGIIAQLLNRALPESFGRSKSAPLGTTSIFDKRRWIKDYLESRRDAGLNTADSIATRGTFDNVTLLQPFADQQWWALREPVGWIPGEADGPGLPRVDVPKGFVTDLASVPSYLWGVFQKTGRYGNAAIYHDWLYWVQDELPGNNRSAADRVFDRAMHDMGVDAATRRLMWAGVRVFGGSYWEENATAKWRGEKRVLARFPDGPNIAWEDWRQKPGVFA